MWRAAVLAGGAAAIVFCLWRLDFRTQAAPRAEQAAQESIPAYGKGPTADELPATLSPDEFDRKETKEAYAVAGKLKKTLFQLPCYCRCDRTHGHRHLLDCFTSYHGARCWACQQEAMFAYAESRKGKTPEQIRDAIIRGEWNNKAP